MYEQFTDRYRKVMRLANEEAQRFNHEYIGTEHILLGLVREGSGVAANVLQNLGVDLRGILLEIEKLIVHGPDDLQAAERPMTPRTKRVLEYAIEESRLLSHNYVGTEHLLLGVLRESECVAYQVLANLGLSLEAVRHEVVALLGPSLGVDQNSGSPPTQRAVRHTVWGPSLGVDQTSGSDQGSPLPNLPLRPADAHKGDFGLALIVGGSRGMSGAAALAGTAALRGGAGLVRLAVPDVCLDTIAGFEPSYMTVPLPSDPAGRIALRARRRIAKWADAATVIACGPGMGRSLGLDALVSWLYANLAKPMIVDADGLNALAARRDALERPGGPRILTPHPGEFARLLGADRVPAERREAAAAELADRCQAVIVLKSHRTCVTDGCRQAINATTGNPGMATGGSGDVLTGLIAALACQGLAPFDAARLGVYLHGLAGDLAADSLGQESVIASDLLRFLPEALKQYRQRGEG